MTNNQHTSPEITIGVGLRHGHYSAALTRPKAIDFIEVHAENFFADGGAANAVLDEVAQHYAVSLHATTLGLGSARGIPDQPLQKLQRLIERTQPMLVSDHACFTWSSLQGSPQTTPVHAGDLLPIAFNEDSLNIMIENVQRVQNSISRQLLVENLSAYITPAGSTMPEVQFLTELCQRADCRLLLDLNNLVVNATNATPRASNDDILATVSAYIKQIPPHRVGEIHLAGCAPALPSAPMIDDHSQPVPQVVWDAYRVALQHIGAVPTLIEWDTALPSWDVLTDEVSKARTIATEELAYDVA
jgi:uncharacterized protein